MLTPSWEEWYVWLLKWTKSYDQQRILCLKRQNWDHINLNLWHNKIYKNIIWWIQKNCITSFFGYKYNRFWQVIFFGKNWLRDWKCEQQQVWERILNAQFKYLHIVYCIINCINGSLICTNTINSRMTLTLDPYLWVGQGQGM